MHISDIPLILENINKLDMNILDFRRANLDSEWHRENVLDLFTRVYCITSGSGQISTQGKTTELTPGNIYIIPAGLNFSYQCSRHLEKLFFHINVKKPDGYDIFYGYKDFIVLKNAEATISALSEQFYSHDMVGGTKVKSIAWNIISAALDSSGACEGEIKEYSPVVRNCLSYINSNLKNNLSCKEIAAALFVSQSTLAAKFRHEIGLPIGKYISDRIMYEAEIMLKKTDMSIKELSETFGFCDQFYFSRKFTAFYGFPPKECRKKRFI